MNLKQIYNALSNKAYVMIDSQEAWEHFCDEANELHLVFPSGPPYYDYVSDRQKRDLNLRFPFGILLEEGSSTILYNVDPQEHIEIADYDSAQPQNFLSDDLSLIINL